VLGADREFSALALGVEAPPSKIKAENFSVQVQLYFLHMHVSDRKSK